MPRKPRNDYPGGIFHVVNRGVAKRTIFECEADRRYFLSRLAWCAKRGLIELIAYCLMDNHFHLLLRSVVGDLAGAMQWIQDLHARRFNRLLERDGPLFRGRYRSGEVKSWTYLAGAFHYAHDNPVDAGLVQRQTDYPHSSARHYATRSYPIWISPIAELYRPDRRLQVAGELVESWLSQPHLEPTDLDHLVCASPAYVQDWIQRQSRLADGSVARVLLVRPDTLLTLVREHRAEPPDLRLPGAPRQNLWEVILTGLLRSASGLSASEISRRTETSTVTVGRRLLAHDGLIGDDGEYAALSATLLHAAIAREYGESRHRAAALSEPGGC